MTNAMENSINVEVVGIIGEIGAGKDTVAEIIENNMGSLGENLTMHLSNPIVDTLHKLFDVPRISFTDRYTKDVVMGVLYNKTPRDLMRSLGTEWGRNMVDPNIWLHITGKRILEFIGEEMWASGGTGIDVRIVIPSIRFQNEVDWLYNLPSGIHHGIMKIIDEHDYSELGILGPGAIRSRLIYVDRPNNPFLDPNRPEHSSEDLASGGLGALQGYDNNSTDIRHRFVHSISNSGGVAELTAKVNKLLGEW